MLAGSDVIALVAIADLESARAFYEGALGLPVIEVTPAACILDAHGTTLRLTLVPELRPAPYTVLGWKVADIDGTARALVGRGVRFERFDGMPQDENGVWTAPSGDRIAWFRDPEGNILSLTQLAPA